MERILWSLAVKSLFFGQAYVCSRRRFLWEPLALVQQGFERVVFVRVEFLDVASDRLPVFVSLVFAVRTSIHTTSIFNSVAEPLPAVYIHMAASSPSDANQLPCRDRYLLLTFCRIKVILSLSPDQLESFAAFFTFPCVKLHFADAVFDIETKIIGETPCSVYDRMMSCFRLGGPFGCCIDVAHVEPEPSRRIRVGLKILTRADTN